MLLADASMEIVMAIRFCVATLQALCLPSKCFATHLLTWEQTLDGSVWLVFLLLVGELTKNNY
jgi:hypothetical protein